MTVGELKDLIADLPDDLLVVVAADSEGNGYSPLASADEVYYEAESSYSGEVVSEEDYMERNGEDAEYEANALVLAPVN